MSCYLTADLYREIYNGNQTVPAHHEFSLADLQASDFRLLNSEVTTGQTTGR
jgi:hypothetical protein